MRPNTTRHLAGPERLEDRSTMDATGFIDIPVVAHIPEHEHLQLHPELSAEVWTSWERYGTSGTGGILRSIGTNAGTAGSPDTPSGQDALALRFSTPITKPTTVRLWTEGIPSTNVYAWVNSAQWRIDGAADGTIRIDASPEQPLSTLSILASGGGRYGIDAIEIHGDTPVLESPAVDETFSAPEELRELIAEAIASSMNSDWRAPEAGETSTTTLLRGAHVNLRSAGGLTIGMNASVQASAPLIAHIYNGSALIESIAVPTGGAFSYENDNGFTDVVFTTTVITPVTVSDITINLDEDQEPASSDPIGIFTSKHYGIANAPVVPMPNSVSYVAGRLKFYNSLTISGESRRYIMRDPQQFTMIRSMVTAGSGRISMVGTIKKDGVDHMGREYGSTSGFPEGYGQWVGENIVMIAPGAPAPISFIVGAYGSRGSIVVTQGASIEALLPPTTMSQQTVDVSLIDMNDQHQTSGVFPPLTEVQEGSSPVFASPGHIANLQYHIRNEALNGGTVTARVYVGWHTGEPARGTLQETFTLSLGGGSTQRISTNVIAPSKPADATSERPIISVVLTLPNGGTIENAKLGKESESREKRVYTKNEDGTTTMRIESPEYTKREQERIHYLTDRALNALLSSNDDRLVAVRDTLGVEHVIELIARNTAAVLAGTNRDANTAAIDQIMAELEDGVEEGADDLLHDREDIGGNVSLPASAQQLLDRAFKNESPTLDAQIAAEIVGDGSTTPRELYKDALQWAMPTNHPLASLLGIQQSVTGRMLTIGFMDMFTQRGNAVNQWIMAIKLQLITDIPATRLMTVVNTGDAAMAATAFKDLLREAQYGSITDSDIETSLPSISMAEPNKTTYVSGDTHVRIRFDIAGTNTGVRNVRVYDGTTLVAISGSTGYINVPIANLPLHGAVNTNNVLDAAVYNLRLEASLASDGSQLSRYVPAIQMHPNLPQDVRSVRVAQDVIMEGNLSTSTDPERARFENEVLSRMTFPSEKGGWSYLMGSTHHRGENLFALDLGKAGDTGLPMRMPATGQITTINLDDGRIKIKHQTSSGDVWYTQYEHMTDILEKITGIAYIGKTEAAVAGLTAEQQAEAAIQRALAQSAIDELIASVLIIDQGIEFGSVGNEGSFTTTSHIHQSLYDENYQPIDQFKWIETVQPGFTSTADISGRKNMLFQWNDDANALVNAAERIILQRENEMNSAGEITNAINVAYAFEADVSPEQRRRVLWDSDAQGWFEINNSGSYTYVNGKRMKWLFTGNIWQFTQE